MRTKRFLVGLTALTLAGGCAAQIKSLEPKLELRNAVQQLAEAKQPGFTLKLTGSADALGAGLKLTADDLRTAFNSSITLAYDQAGDGAEDDRMLAAATVDGVAGTEIRLVDGTVYLKAPVADLAKKLGGDLTELRKEAAGAGALFDGQWVAFDAREAARSAAPDLPAEQVLAEVKKGAQNLFDGADIVRDRADAKHLIVTSTTTKAYTEVKRLVTAINGDLAAEAGDAPKERPVVVDLWIDQGKLTALEVNVLQFVDGATGRAAVRLEVAAGVPITAPAGATKVDPGALAGSGAVTARAGGIAVEEAEDLGFTAQMLAEEAGGDPRSYLRKAIAEQMAGTPVEAKVVRRGVAQVTVEGESACVTVPKSLIKEPLVTPGVC